MRCYIFEKIYQLSYQSYFTGCHVSTDIVHVIFDILHPDIEYVENVLLNSIENIMTENLIFDILREHG